MGQVGIKPECAVPRKAVSREDVMCKRYFRYYFLLLMRISVSFGSYFPPDVKICSINDRNLNECVRESANKMVKYLGAGLRSLNAIPMDPFLIPEAVLPKGNDLLYSLSFKLKNVGFIGWNEGIFTRTEVDPVNRCADISFHIPVLHEYGLYELDGSIASIPLKGSSDFDIYYKNMTFNFKASARLENRRGFNYLVIENFQRNIRAANATFDLRNLFNDRNISDLTNSILNKNAPAVLVELGPVFDAILGDMAQILAQRILDRVPFNAFFT